MAEVTKSKPKKIIITCMSIALIILFLMPFLVTKRVRRGTAYTDKSDVAIYIKQYHELPPNYITNYGLEYLTNHSMNTSSYIMGGDTHINDGTLSNFNVSNNATLKECDIAGNSYAISGGRGGQRLVYTCNTQNVRVFYTYNHYTNYTELTSFQLQLARNIFWIIFGCYAVAFVIVCICISNKKENNYPNKEVSNENPQN